MAEVLILPCGNPVAWDVLAIGIRRLAEIVPGRTKAERMLSRCANSQCGKPFLRLREGKLFLVETDRGTRPGESGAPSFVRARQPQRRVEHYWLCDDCAPQWTLVYDRDSGVGLIPLRRPASNVAAAGDTARSGAA